MRYLLIDRILQVEFEKKLLAVKNVALSEDVYSEHFFGFPVMPGALIIECLAQAGTALLEISTDFKKKALLVMVEHAKFRRLIHPGDQLSIAVNVISSDSPFIVMDGTVHAAERLAADARLTFTHKEIGEFYPEKIKPMMDAVYSFWLKDAKLIGFPIIK